MPTCWRKSCETWPTLSRCSGSYGWSARGGAAYSEFRRRAALIRASAGSEWLVGPLEWRGRERARRPDARTRRRSGRVSRPPRQPRIDLEPQAKA